MRVFKFARWLMASSATSPSHVIPMNCSHASRQHWSAPSQVNIIDAPGPPAALVVAALVQAFVLRPACRQERVPAALSPRAVRVGGQRKVKNGTSGQVAVTHNRPPWASIIDRQIDGPFPTNGTQCAVVD